MVKKRANVEPFSTTFSTTLPVFIKGTHPLGCFTLLLLLQIKQDHSLQNK